MQSISEIVDLAKGFAPFPEERKSQELIVALLQQTAAPFSRHQFEPGHITCTALIVHPEHRSILLVHHHRHRRWLLPGGHVEERDSALTDTARREAQEETGVRILADADRPLVGLDVHGIPPHKNEPYHLHHDLIFALAAETDDYATTEEAPRIAWCDAAALDQYGVPCSIKYAAERVIG